MAFDKKTPDNYMKYSSEEEAEYEVRPAGRPSRRRVSAGSVFVFVFLFLTAASLFLLYLDMKRDLRHGVYRCEDQRMMELPAVPDVEKIALASEGIGAVAKAHPDISQYMMLIPSAACVQSGYIPAEIRVRNQAQDLKMIRGAMPSELNWIDLLEVFSLHAGEKLYYATDIYLTGWGCRYASNKAIEGMGFEAPQSRDLCYLLSDRFRGKLAADGTLLQRLLKSKRERIEIYVPETEEPYYRVDGETNISYGSLYDRKAVDTENQFDVFFGGERPLTIIHTGAVNEETLFVIGDREADCIVPRFVSSFENIVLIHPSKCSDRIEKLIGKYKPTKILYLYGANSFMRDRTLLHFLGK